MSGLDAATTPRHLRVARESGAARLRGYTGGVSFLRRMFSADYRAAVAAEAAGNVDLAAERYALAGEHEGAVRMHLARAARAGTALPWPLRPSCSPKPRVTSVPTAGTPSSPNCSIG